MTNQVSGPQNISWSHHSGVSDSYSVSQPTQSIMSPERPEKLIITSGCDELGDFIPLSPLHHSDTDDTRVPFSDVGSFENSQMEPDTLDAYEYMNRPYFPCLPKLTDESCRKVNMDNREHSDPDDSDQSSRCKSLFSDIASKRTGVFSRLGGVAWEVLPLKKDDCYRGANSVREINAQIEDNTRMDRLIARTEYSVDADKSEEDIMDDWQRRHYNWRKSFVKYPSFKQESEDCASKKRKSVFLRLSGFPEEGINDDDEDVITNRSRKRKTRLGEANQAF